MIRLFSPFKNSEGDQEYSEYQQPLQVGDQKEIQTVFEPKTKGWG